MNRTRMMLITLFCLTLLCGGCYTEVHEPKTYSVQEFRMTESVKTSDMTVKRPQPKKDWTNLWGLF